MRIFVDMDGTLAKWNNVEFEQLFEQGYYRNLKPNMDIVNEVNKLISMNKDIYVLSAYLTESNYAKEEKKLWLKQYLPELKEENQIFVPYGTNKAEYLKKNYSPINNSDYLIDDYTNNLLEWKEYGGIGVKYLNGINHTRGTWKGLMISYDYNNSLQAGLIPNTNFNKYPLSSLVLAEELKKYEITLFNKHETSSNIQPKKFYIECIYKGEYYIIFETFPSIENDNNIIPFVRRLERLYQPSYYEFISTEKFLQQYYERHYPVLSKCKDFDILCKNCDWITLDNMEYTIFLWNETNCVEIDSITNEIKFNVDETNAVRCNSKFISWYEGNIKTEDLLSYIKESHIENTLEEDYDITD